MSNEKIQNEKPNRLAKEKSPYLLQHAYNPVDWFPWSDEGFAKAKAEDKPIFLSIGYSTCHWCHVMERESFEDEEVARVLNDGFVAIKVDREERPDIDHIYMNVCQALTGSGGWPLTIIMTPEKKPFFVGTYFPKKSRMGYPGIVEILEKIINAWRTEREELLESSEKIMEHIQKELEGDSEGELSMEAAHKAFSGFKTSFGGEYGGFGRAPKFPTPHNLQFLLRYWKTTGNSEALSMVEATLESMYRGGIYDHIGFGFSRYSTDREWLVPHFEKMLYDNALLAMTYIEAFLAVGKEQYREVSRQIFEYVLRDMTSPEGGFYSAEDADSEGEEGKFYVWSPEEIAEILGEEDAEKFCSYYGITGSGNFEGKSIPNLIGNKEAFGRVLFNPMEELREKVFAAREKRVHPYKDDKILTSWNGLMIAALSMGARAMGEDRYLKAAEKAVAFIREKLIRKDGRLLARYREGEAAYSAYLDDYAFLIWGLIELFEAAFKPEYLELAIDLNRDMLRYFHDEDKGGLYLYGSDSEQLIARPKDVYDGATPSGNSVATLNFLRLSRLTGDPELEDKVYEQLNTFAGIIENYPMGYTYMLMSLLFIKSKASEIVIVGEKTDGGVQRLVNTVNRSFLPYSVLVLKDIKADGDISKYVTYIEGYEMVKNQATVYVCENFACSTPITDVQEFKNIIAH